MTTRSSREKIVLVLTVVAWCRTSSQGGLFKRGNVFCQNPVHLGSRAGPRRTSVVVPVRQSLSLCHADQILSPKIETRKQTLPTILYREIPIYINITPHTTRIHLSIRTTQRDLVHVTRHTFKTHVSHKIKHKQGRSGTSSAPRTSLAPSQNAHPSASTRATDPQPPCSDPVRVERVIELRLYCESCCLLLLRTRQRLVMYG